MYDKTHYKKKKNPETGGECYMVCKCLLEDSRSQIKLKTFNKKLEAWLLSLLFFNILFIVLLITK